MLKHSWMIVFAALLGMGCASYTTPGRGARMQAVGAPTASEIGPGTDGSIRQAFEKKPLAAFPTAVAVVRIQTPGYSSKTAEGWGQGQYSIVTERDVERPEYIERLAHLPQLKGIAPINHLLIHGNLDSDVVLRRAAAQLQADILLVYTLDTTFTTQDRATPLTLITLGFSPNEQVRVNTTASALLLDTRNGYVYGLAEASARKEAFTSAWHDSAAIDDTRRQTESQAFEKLVGELETTWKGVVATYAHASVTPNVHAD